MYRKNFNFRSLVANNSPLISVHINEKITRIKITIVCVEIAHNIVGVKTCFYSHSSKLPCGKIKKTSSLKKS